MNLGFHYHVPAINKNGKIFMPGYLGFFIDSLSPYFTNIYCFLHTPLENEKKEMDYQIKSKNLILVNYGVHSSIPKRLFWNFFNSNSILKKYEKNIDIFLVRASTPSLYFFERIFKSKIALLLVSDAVEGLDNLNQNKIRLLLIKIWANFYQKYEHKLVSKRKTIVNSDLLFNRLKAINKDIKLIRTTTLRDTDFHFREDTCKNNKIIFFYAGRVTKIKGLLDIIHALNIVFKNSSRDFVFNIAGMVNDGDNILNEIKNLSKKLNIDKKINFLGYVAAGDDLLSLYRSSDFFISASQGSSEGFPRTLWEAMASSLPIITTNVSSIPFILSECAVLTPPKNIKAMSKAIENIILDKHLRIQNIKLAYELSKGNTLNKRAKDMYNFLTKNI